MDAVFAAAAVGFAAIVVAVLVRPGAGSSRAPAIEPAPDVEAARPHAGSAERDAHAGTLDLAALDIGGVPDSLRRTGRGAPR